MDENRDDLQQQLEDLIDKAVGIGGKDPPGGAPALDGCIALTLAVGLLDVILAVLNDCLGLLDAVPGLLLVAAGGYLLARRQQLKQETQAYLASQEELRDCLEEMQALVQEMGSGGTPDY